MTRILFAVICIGLILLPGCMSYEERRGEIFPEVTWLEAWDRDFSERTPAILVGGHARELPGGAYEVRGYFVSFLADFPPIIGFHPTYAGRISAESTGRGDGQFGQVPPVDLASGESYTLVSPPLFLTGNISHFEIDAGYGNFPFEIYCPFKDASTVCEWERPSRFSPSDVTEHFLYARLGAWEMPTIDIIDLACTHPLANYDMSCTFGTWNWYDLAPAEAKLVARLRARSDGLFPVVQQWEIPFGKPLAHNDTREYTLELGNAAQWAVDNTTNDFYIEIVAQRPDNPVSMSHLMTHILVNPIAETR